MRLVLLGALSIVLLTACSSRRPLAELEEEAEITGDWSAVQRYRKMDKRMNRVNGENFCDNGYVIACVTKGEQEECGCVSPLDRGLRR